MRDIRRVERAEMFGSSGAPSVRRSGVRRTVQFVRTHPTASGFLVLLLAAVITAGALPAAQQESLRGWASTNVGNLRTHPLGALVVSTLIPAGDAFAWVVLGALGMFTADALLGWRRSLLLATAAQVAGTLISEGTVAWQVAHGALPEAALHLDDVGPSYVVVCALTFALVYGWRGDARSSLRFSRPAAGALGLLALRDVLFAGLSRLDVTALGHSVSIVVATVGGGALLRRRTRARVRR